MASDATYSPSAASIRDAVNHHYVAAIDAGHVPGFDWSQRLAHWALRIPLAGIMLVYGLQKFPDMFVAPGAYGVPAVLFILAAIAELLGPVALAIGGMIETWRPRQGWLRLSGDILTRAGALAGISAALGVIAFFYWGAIRISDPQILMLGLATYLFLRGNR